VESLLISCFEGGGGYALYNTRITVLFPTDMGGFFLLQNMRTESGPHPAS